MSGTLTDGDAWRNQAMGAVQGFENDSGMGGRDTVATGAAPNRQGGVTQARGQQHAPTEGARPNSATNESDDSNTTEGSADTREKNHRDQLAGREGNTDGGKDTGSNGGNKSSAESKKKSAKRLNSSRARSVELSLIHI